MALKKFNSVDGFSVGESQTDVIFSNADVTANNLSVTGEANLGPIGNVTITGGTSGQAIVTDGLGTLTFADVSGTSNLVAPMPFYIATACSYTVSSNFQGLFSIPIEIDGDLEVDGVLVQVEGALTTTNGQLIFNQDSNLIGDSNLLFYQSNTTLVANNLAVSTAANLGSVSNLKITGGSSGQYLRTDGTGNLTWAAGGGGGGGSPGGSNTYIQ